MIEIKNFCKKYDKLVAVRKLSLFVERGQIYGFIGPNGAGKTTTIRFLATLLDPTSGTAVINGFDVVRQVREVRRSIGFMPDSFGVYNGMRVWEFLDFFAVAYGVRKEHRRRLIHDVLALVDLHEKRDDLVNTLSRGMKQRLCLAKTLVHDPPVLILDEPASGLDPRARIKSMSDHRIVMLKVLSDPRDAERYLSHHPKVVDVGSEDHTVRFEFSGTDEDLANLWEELIQRKHKVVWVQEHRPNLETIFMQVTKGRVQ